MPLTTQEPRGLDLVLVRIHLMPCLWLSSPDEDARLAGADKAGLGLLEVAFHLSRGRRAAIGIGEAGARAGALARAPKGIPYAGEAQAQAHDGIRYGEATHDHAGDDRSHEHDVSHGTPDELEQRPRQGATDIAPPRAGGLGDKHQGGVAVGARQAQGEQAQDGEHDQEQPHDDADSRHLTFLHKECGREQDDGDGQEQRPDTKGELEELACRLGDGSAAGRDDRDDHGYCDDDHEDGDDVTDGAAPDGRGRHGDGAPAPGSCPGLAALPLLCV